MKKLFVFCIVAVLALITVSCNMDVPVSEINSMLSMDMRCGFSGGIPLRYSQAQKIKALVDFINYNHDHPDLDPVSWEDTKVADRLSSNAYLKADYLKNLSAGAYSLDTFAITIHNSLNGARLLYGSVQMREVYKYAYAFLAVDGVDEELYCACGYEFCEKGSACTIDKVTDVPVCGANTTIEQRFTADNLECNPINMSTAPLRKVLVEHQLPILEFMAGFRKRIDTITIDDSDNDRVKSIINCDNLTDAKELRSCSIAQQFYKYMLECINIGDSDFPEDYRSKCPAYDSTKSNCQTRPCMGELYLAGFPHTREANFYNGLAVIVNKEFQAVRKEDEDKALITELDNTTVSKFLTDQIAPLYSSDVLIDFGNVVADVKANVNSMSDAEVLTIMRTFFKKVYGQYSEGMAKLHRQLFGWLTVDNMTDPQIAQLYTSTLTVQLKCNPQTLPNGDISGLKKYCIYRDDLPASLNDILKALQATTESVVKMADSMIMEESFAVSVTVKQKTGKVLLDTVNSEMYQSFPEPGTEGDDYKQMKGDWLLLRCPNNASCMLNNQCGMCTNGVKGLNEDKVVVECVNGKLPCVDGTRKIKDDIPVVCIDGAYVTDTSATTGNENGGNGDGGEGGNGDGGNGDGGEGGNGDGGEGGNGDGGEGGNGDGGEGGNGDGGNGDGGSGDEGDDGNKRD